jgi:hypothetical protein
LSQNLRIEDLLGELSQEGQLDSRGVFTLDAQAAVQKLSEFQLNDPSDYLVKIVQAAVACGARRCEMKVAMFRIECWLWGANFDVTDLGSIPGELLRPATASPARYHLAVALNGAVSTVIQTIELAGFDGTCGQKVVWKSGETQTSSWTPPQGAEGSLLYLQFNRNKKGRAQAIDDFIGKRDIFGMLSGDESGWTRDEKILHQKFDLAAMPIQINGHGIRCGFKSLSDYNKSGWTFTGLFAQESFAQELFFPGSSLLRVPVQSSKPCMVELKSGQVAAKQMLTQRPGSKARKAAVGTVVSCHLWAGAFRRQKDGLFNKVPGLRLILVDDGFLVFDQTFGRGSSFGVSGSGVVIASAEGLRKDLSSLQLIDSEAFHERIRAAAKLLSLLAENQFDLAAEAGSNLLLEMQSCQSNV